MESDNKNKYSLTDGSILKKLLLVAVPIMGTHLMQMAYNLIDLFWLGRVGSDAVAAVGAAGMYLWLSFGFLLIGRMGAEIGVSQYLGKGDKKSALAFSQNAMVIAFVLGLLFGLTMVVFNQSLIGFFNFNEKEIAAVGAVYIQICGITMPLNFMAGVAIGTYNASGNSRTPFLIAGLGLALNIVLDPIFIFTLGLGVKGAAIATLIAQSISGTVMLSALLLNKNRPFEHYSFRFRPDLNKIKMILKWSVPIGLESIFFCFLAMVTSRIQASFGADAIAVSKIGEQIESLSWLIGGGFGSALIAFIGQNYGAEKWERIRQGTKLSAFAMTLWGAFVTFLLLVPGAAIFSFFLPVPRLIPLGRLYLFILAFAQLPMNIEIVASAAFKGTGRTIPPSLVSIVCNIIRPILAYILSRTDFGLYGIWIAISMTAIFRSLWVCIWYLAAEKKTRGIRMKSEE
jgi:putative MATE family efflux protein